MRTFCRAGLILCEITSIKFDATAAIQAIASGKAWILI